jgi:hypothetical protein
MSAKSGNNVKPPVTPHKGHGDAPENHMMERGKDDQHHGENTKAPQDARKIGQSNGAGRPPLMKK